MKWPYASLTDQQVRETYVVAPEICDLYAMVLGDQGYQSFKTNRQTIRAMGGELLLIGWPDGTTITYQSHARPAVIDFETLVKTYSANAALHRITTRKQTS